MASCSNCGCDTIEGIYCNVANCVHHTTDNCCTAKQIKVDCQSAVTKSETSCSTFELKD